MHDDPITTGSHRQGSHRLLRCWYGGGRGGSGGRQRSLDHACQAGHSGNERLHCIGSLLAGLGLRLGLRLRLSRRLQVHPACYIHATRAVNSHRKVVALGCTESAGIRWQIEKEGHAMD